MLVQTKDPSEFWMCLRLPKYERRNKHFVGKERTRFYETKEPEFKEPEQASEYNPKPLKMTPLEKVTQTMFIGPPDLRQREGEFLLAWIKRWVAFKHGVSVEALEGPCRKRNLVAARQEYFFWARRIGKRSYPEIGMSCGNRDHTTALHGAKKHRDKLGDSAPDIVTHFYTIYNSAKR